MKYLQYLSCLIIILLVGCNEVDPKGEKDVQKFVQQWNQDHTPLKAPYLESCYMPTVNYYGKQQTRVQVLQDKQWLFQQFPDYTQRIVNNQLDITKTEGTYLVTFTKRVTYNGQEADYPAYLSLMVRNGNFKILREGVAENAKNTNAPIFPNARNNKAYLSKTRQLFGDFNGDGLSDFATVISPETTTTANNTVVCNDDCNSRIIFSNKDIKDIVIQGAYKSQLDNLQDLNNDQADEIGFWDIKPSTKTLYVYDAYNNRLLTQPIVINTAIHKNLKLIDVFKKTGPNKITITKSVQENGKWVLKSEVIRLD